MQSGAGAPDGEEQLGLGMPWKELSEGAARLNCQLAAIGPSLPLCDLVLDVPQPREHRTMMTMMETIAV